MTTPDRDRREAAIDRLYTLPLAEFTKARNELAARLLSGGDAGAASEVKLLRKPTVAAWALNQVRHRNPQQVDELIEAGHRLREAQERLLGGGGREALDRAAQDERRRVAELAREAERELSSGGRGPSATVQEKLRNTLHAVATDPDAREGLRAGRLVREYQARGLGPLAEVVPQTTPSSSGRVRRLEEQLEQARHRQGDLDTALHEARLKRKEAEQRASEATSALNRAEAAERQAMKRAARSLELVADLEAKVRKLSRTSS